ncbi:carbonic anhydrase [Chitinophagaceae bacterium LWZ2-11]
MKKILCIICLLFSIMSYSQNHHWGYEGAESPDHWGELESGKLCGTGMAQSPINVTGSKLNKKLPQITFKYNPCEINDITDNGHSLQFDFRTGGTIAYKNKIYNLVQFHAHEESEHTIDGVRYPLELHFVHKAADGSILVIGVMVKDGNENTYFEKLKVFKNIAKNSKIDTLINFDPEKLYPQKHSYYTYSGSLTTPPCSESVDWIIFKNPITMTVAEIEEIKQHLPKSNNRPIQPLNDRVISNN